MDEWGRIAALRSSDNPIVTWVGVVRAEKNGAYAREAGEICSAIVRRDISYRDIRAKRKEIDVTAMSVNARKFMSDDQPRRISRIELDLRMPLFADHPDRKLLESAARGCPVHHSIHPDIDVVMNWTWA